MCAKGVKLKRLEHKQVAQAIDNRDCHIFAYCKKTELLLQNAWLKVDRFQFLRNFLCKMRAGACYRRLFAFDESAPVGYFLRAYSAGNSRISGKKFGFAVP
jgi:hypothetical protein